MPSEVIGAREGESAADTCWWAQSFIDLCGFGYRTPYLLFSMDQEKCFDTISLEPLAALLVRCGADPVLLDVLALYQRLALFGRTAFRHCALR